MFVSSALQTIKKSFFTVLFPVVVFTAIYKDYEHTKEYKLVKKEKNSLE